MAYYYPKTIKNMIIAFCDRFNDIVVKKYDKDGNVLKDIKVPIRWGPIDKFHDIRRENYNEMNDPYYLSYPRLAVTGPELNYNSDRATNVNQMREFYNDTLELSEIDSFYSDPNPTPYDYGFVLHIKTRSFDHYCQILENILPYFNPSNYLRVKEFSFLNIERNVKMNLDGGVSPDMQEEQQENTRREINATINFTLEGFMYYPIDSTKNIKIVNSKYFVSDSSLNSTESVLSDSYSTSAINDLSAAPESYDTSGTRDDGVYYFTEFE